MSSLNPHSLGELGLAGQKRSRVGISAVHLFVGALCQMLQLWVVLQADTQCLHITSAGFTPSLPSPLPLAEVHLVLVSPVSTEPSRAGSDCTPQDWLSHRVCCALRAAECKHSIGFVCWSLHNPVLTWLQTWHGSRGASCVFCISQGKCSQNSVVADVFWHMVVLSRAFGV